MKNRDEVLRQSAIAAANHATGVRQALALLTQAVDASEVAFAEGRLRDALVLLACGHDGAHDGSSADARKAAAVAAILAWGSAS